MSADGPEERRALYDEWQERDIDECDIADMLADDYEAIDDEESRTALMDVGSVA
jgi:transcription elongation factor GreA-like protein